MGAVSETQEMNAARESQKERQLLARIADFLFHEQLITAEERLRFLASLEKEG